MVIRFLSKFLSTRAIYFYRCFLDGPSGRTAEVVVIVDILDISDHPPLFLMSNYSGMVFENAPVGSTVLTVKTSDLDMVIIRTNRTCLGHGFMIECQD